MCMYVYLEKLIFFFKLNLQIIQIKKIKEILFIYKKKCKKHKEFYRRDFYII